ncbi:tir2p [Saccharomyces arboricola H-6]|uniref:Tir2p n=1 Tax=Saccharomyces arboricola (strain H-6 / AS 2.3317 / CBS 10644) TaxID=1160507 RepID=J8Q299_SACAR|nr:tir2p [Saccharomyces arboricola H-6]
MAYIKIALLAALAAFTSAQTQEEIDELNVILDDVKSNLAEYISLAEDSSSGFSLSSLPSGILEIGMALASATDDSYTTLYSEVDFAGVSSLLTMVPWYSRLKSELEALEGTTTSAAASSSIVSSTEATTSAVVSSTEATTSAVASSTEATSSAVASSTEATTSSAVASSTEATTSAVASSAAASSAAASSAAASSAKTSASAKTSVSASVSAVSQITDGQVQATSTVAEQTENGAAKVAVGMGAGVMAAAAMLL